MFSACTTYEKQLRIEKTRLSHQVWSHGGSTFKKKRTLNGHFSRPAETDPYVVQLEKSISQRCDTKCCHTNVAADPTIIECDEDVMLWGKMFDCNWVIIGLDLGVGDLF